MFLLQENGLPLRPERRTEFTMSMQDLTKIRLLEAAGEEFAEKGFEAATIRSICQRAEANVAAVNYHFGDKEQLYIQAVLEAQRCGSEILPESAFEEGTPAEHLRVFIHHFLANVLAMSRNNSWHRALMLREMIRPTSACETLVREAIRPRFERLQKILRRVCPGADPRRLNALSFSVIGQCLHYKVARAVSERLVGPEAYEALDVEYLTDHITTFTLAALGQGPPFDESGEPAGAGTSTAR
jgi:TetR/AcrR family transcriptional regulator, regulator of cefoperazone and chloramphenicol sensitivity